jgi:hypothetical protein
VIPVWIVGLLVAVAFVAGLCIGLDCEDDPYER